MSISITLPNEMTNLNYIVNGFGETKEFEDWKSIITFLKEKYPYKRKISIETISKMGNICKEIINLSNGNIIKTIPIKS